MVYFLYFVYGIIRFLTSRSITAKAVGSKRDTEAFPPTELFSLSVFVLYR